MKDEEYAECFDTLIASMKDSSFSIFDRWNSEDIARITRDEARRAPRRVK